MVQEVDRVRDFIIKLHYYFICNYLPIYCLFTFLVEVYGTYVHGQSAITDNKHEIYTGGLVGRSTGEL